jgi:hypothetical protein
MAFDDHNGLTEIENRDHLRAEAGLPLLDTTTEIARLQSVGNRAALEREWKRRKSEFALWIEQETDFCLGWAAILLPDNRSASRC